MSLLLGSALDDFSMTQKRWICPSNTSPLADFFSEIEVTKTEVKTILILSAMIELMYEVVNHCVPIFAVPRTINRVYL